MDINQIVKQYRDYRDLLSEKRKEFESLETALKEKMYELETQMLELSGQLGVDSFKTPSGTAFKTTKTYARLSEGPESSERRIKWMVENNDFGLITSHVNKSHTIELIDSGINPKDFGVDFITEYVIQFRK